MVFKMITSGKHIKKINGNFLKDQEFNLDINPNGENKIFLKTQELDNGKRKIYKNAFNSIDDFMRDFNNNNNSLFELNKNIYRPRYVTPKYNRIRHTSRIRQKHNPRHYPKPDTKHRQKYGKKHLTKHAPKHKKTPQKKTPQKKTLADKKKNIKKKIDKLKKEMKEL